MEASYSELRSKEVVNLTTGAKMGKIVDLIFNLENRNVLGIVVPGERKLFKPTEDIFIPWKNVTKIGDDVILVDVEISNCANIIRTSGKDGCNFSAEDFT